MPPTAAIAEAPPHPRGPAAALAPPSAPDASAPGAPALAAALAHVLFGMGFRNVRAGTPDDLGAPAMAAPPLAPDVAARTLSGRLNAYALTGLGALGGAGEAERLRALASRAEAAGVAFWAVAPWRERDAVAERLREVGIGVRLLGV